MFRNLARIGLASTLLASCATVAGSGAPPASLEEPKVYYSTQVVLGACTNGEETGLLPIIAASVITQGVNRIGQAIKAAAEGKTEKVIARRSIELAKGDGLGPCVTVARGWFYRALPTFNEGQVAGSPFFENQTSAWPDNDELSPPAKYWRLGLFLAATPDFYFQGRIVASSDGSAYTIHPRLATLDQPLVSQFFRPGGERSVVVSIAISDKGVDLEKGGGTTIVVGPMKPGQVIEFPNELCAAVNPLLPIPAPPAPAPKLTQCPGKDAQFTSVMRSQFQSEWFSVALTDKPKPMSLQALVTETQSPSDFLAFVSDVFSDVKSDLGTELKRELIPNVGDTAEETERQADEKLANEYDVAFAKGYTDLSACIANASEPARKIVARASLRSLLQAGRKAEKDPGITDSDVEALVLAGDNQICSAIREKLK